MKKPPLATQKERDFREERLQKDDKMDAMVPDEVKKKKEEGKNMNLKGKFETKEDGQGMPVLEDFDFEKLKMDSFVLIIGM